MSRTKLHRLIALLLTAFLLMTAPVVVMGQDADGDAAAEEQSEAEDSATEEEAAEEQPAEEISPQRVEAQRVTGSLPGNQFAQIWLEVVPEFPDATIQVLVDWSVPNAGTKGLQFAVLDPGGVNSVVGGKKLTDVRAVANGNPLFQGADNQMEANLRASGLTNYTLVMINDGSTDASFTISVSNSKIVDASGQVQDPSAAMTDSTDETAAMESTEMAAETTATTEAAPAATEAVDTDAAAVVPAPATDAPAASTADTPTASSGAVIPPGLPIPAYYYERPEYYIDFIDPTLLAGVGAAPAATDGSMMDSAAASTSDAASATDATVAVTKSTKVGDVKNVSVSATKLEGALGPDSIHYLGLVSNVKDGSISLDMTFQPQDSRDVNIFVVNERDLALLNAGRRIDTLAISAGNRVDNAEKNVRNAKIQTSGLGRYTVLVRNSSTSASAEYTIMVTGGILSDDSGQTSTAQSMAIESTDEAADADTTAAAATPATANTAAAPATTAAAAPATTAATTANAAPAMNTVTVTNTTPAANVATTNVSTTNATTNNVVTGSVATDNEATNNEATTNVATNAPAQTSAAPAASTTSVLSVATTGATAGATYTIKSGDSISKIARDVYGDVQKYQQLCTFNKLSNCDRLEVGDTLQLPTQAELNALGSGGAAPAAQPAASASTTSAAAASTTTSAATTTAATRAVASNSASSSTASNAAATASSADDSGLLDIVETAAAGGNFTILVDAITKANLARSLKGNGPFTVFAPTDDAFNALPGNTLDTLLDDPGGALTQILLYHVSPGKLLEQDLTDGLTVDSIEGREVNFGVDGGGVTINGAKLVVTDIETSNGVIHVIDSVISPPANNAAASSGATTESAASTSSGANRTPVSPNVALASTLPVLSDVSSLSSDVTDEAVKVVYKTASAIDEVADFYRAEMSQLDFTTTRAVVTARAATLAFTSSDGDVRIGVTEDAGSDLIVVELTVTS